MYDKLAFFFGKRMWIIKESRQHITVGEMISSLTENESIILRMNLHSLQGDAFS